MRLPVGKAQTNIDGFSGKIPGFLRRRVACERHAGSLWRRDRLDGSTRAGDSRKYPAGLHLAA